jgi:Family of unknown function (DUF6220)
VSEAKVIFFALALVYLLGVVVQFFLAGLALFSAGSYETHRWVGFVLGVIAVALLALAIGAKMPRSLTALTTVLVALNALEIVLVQVDIDEIKALHVVNALAIAFVANTLVQRCRRYLATRLAT